MLRTSDYVAGFLNSETQKAYAANCARSEENEVVTQKKEDKGEDPTPTPPAALTRDMLNRIRRIVFSPNVSTLEQAIERTDALLSALEDDDNKGQDAPPKKVADDGKSSHARTR